MNSSCTCMTIICPTGGEKGKNGVEYSEKEIPTSSKSNCIIF